MIQILDLFRRNMLKKILALIDLTRRFDEQTLAAKIRPAFVRKDDNLFGKFFGKWKGDNK